jgi:hypothetical protein
MKPKKLKYYKSCSWNYSVSNSLTHKKAWSRHKSIPLLILSGRWINGYNKASSWKSSAVGT